ncbi:MAG TPA: MBL fold metallo-hydrolase [Saprospiraceae bacterium]|nr:MBL fold metallo-hydrolase [Saprospiraceae bacterium]
MQIKQFIFNPFQENTYLLWDDALNTVVIDPGCREAHERKQLHDFIKQKGLKLSQCWLTHAHLDHVFGCQWIRDQFGLEPLMHEQEEQVYLAGPQVAEMYGVGPLSLPKSYQLISETNELSLGDFRPQLFHTPGHSPGSICYYFALDHLLISGDVIFKQGMGRTDLPGGNHKQLMHSIQEIVLKLPLDTIIYSGHGEPTSVGEEMIYYR